MVFPDSWEVKWLTIAEIKLRSFVGGSQESPPLVFVAGWGSTPETWRHFMPVLARSFRVHYIETREKASAEPDAIDQSLDAASGDISAVAAQIFDYRNGVVVGASTGANLVLMALLAGVLRPQAAVLLAPHMKSPAPKATRLLMFLPKATLRIVRAILVRAASSPLLPPAYTQQRGGLISAIAASDLDRLRKSASAWRRLSVAGKSIEAVPQLMVVSVHEDAVHRFVEADGLASQLQADTLRVRNFAELHSSTTAERVRRYLSSEAI